MATFWKVAAHSVDHMFSFVFLLFVIIVISHCDFEGWILVLIVSVPDLCILLLSTPSDGHWEGRQTSLHYENTPRQHKAISHGCENDNFLSKTIDIFSYFCSKHRLWVHVRTEAVLTIIHNLCFRAKIRK